MIPEKFDPAYFMYFEDTDFCIRLRRAGWKIVYLPDAKVKHHLGGSSGKDWRTSAWMISCYNQSRYYYHFSNSLLQGWALKAMVLLGAALRLAAWAAVAFARPAKRDQVRLFWNVFCRTVRMRPNPERQP
jgi:N-acetylglucosaminyl-diphospho-decaprenol L-rhamnosyltransferase